MAKRARKGDFLLCRDGLTDSCYKLFRPTTRPRLKTFVNYCRWEGHTAWGPIQYCAADKWHRLMPNDLHLKPGGGPIRIRVERVK